MQSAFDDLIPKRQPGGVPGVVIGSHPSTARQQLDPQMAAADLAAKGQEAEARRVQLERDQIKLAAERDAAQAAMIKPSGNVHGDAYLATLPPDVAAQVHDIAIGNITLGPKPFANPQSAAILKHVVNYDPTFDMTDFNGRAKANAAFRVGVQGQNATALNTALEHAQTVNEDIKALGNTTGFMGSIVNPIRNTYRSWVDDPRVANLPNDMRAFGGEAERVFANGGGTEGGRTNWQGSIGLNDGPQTQQSILQHDTKLFGSRLSALQYQERQALGPNAKLGDLLSPQAQAAYQALLSGSGGAGPTPPDQPPPDRPYPGAPMMPPGGTGGPGGGPPGGPSGGPMADKSAKYYGNGDGGPDQIAIPLSMKGESLQKDPVQMAAAKHLAAMLADRKIPDAEIMAYAQNLNANPASVAANLKFRHDNPTYTGGYNTNSLGFKNVPLTTTQWIGNNLGTSPVGTAAIHAANAVSAGSLPSATANPDATRALIEGTGAMNPKSAFAGNVVGGGLAVGGLEAGGAGIAGRLGLGAKALPWVARGADTAYGAVSGANGDPENPGMGALLGGATAGLGGAATRKVVGGLGSLLSPTGGSMAPLYDAGVFPTIGQRVADKGILGRIVNTGEQALQSVPGLGSIVARARNIPRAQFQLGAFNSALGDIGEQLPAGMKPGTEPHAFAVDKFGQAYDQARSGMQFAPDQQFVADTTAFHQGLDNGILTEPAAAQVKKVIATAVGSRMPANGVMGGASYQAAGSDLGRAAQAWSKDPATAQQANALNDFISIFDQTARRSSHPDAVAALDAADKGYAKLVRIQDAAAARGGEAGTFSPTQFDRSVQRNSSGVRSSAYNQGNALMQDYATAGKGLVDTLPNSGTGERLMTGQIATGIGGGGAAAAGLPVAALAKGAPVFAPYLPGANFLTTRAMAPNAQRLPGALAPLGRMLDTSGNYVDDRAAIVGKLALPALLGWQQGQ